EYFLCESFCLYEGNYSLGTHQSLSHLFSRTDYFRCILTCNLAGFIIILEGKSRPRKPAESIWNIFPRFQTSQGMAYNFWLSAITDDINNRKLVPRCPLCLHFA